MHPNRKFLYCEELYKYTITGHEVITKLKIIFKDHADNCSVWDSNSKHPFI